jgi:dTDP-4-dehydrorhamnose reductase
MPRILLLGAGGQLGKVLERKLRSESELTALTHAQLDLADADAVGEAVRKARPEILINAAAYTAVDRAEQELDLAHKVNAVAPGVMAQEMAALGGWLIHYSTDYVFDGSGTKPWVETDSTGPLNVYGQSKLDGEKAIAEAHGQHVILRTSWVYAAEGKNFLHTMLRLGRERSLLKVVDDQVGAPTTAEALTEATVAVLKTLAGDAAPAISGVYHLACAGETSWCSFAKAIFDEFSLRQAAPEVVPIPTEAYPTPARRPYNSRMCCDKFGERFGYCMPEWRSALHDVSATLLAAS